MLSSVWTTLSLAILTIGISTVLALVLVPFALGSRAWARIPVSVFTWIGRSLPTLSLIFAAYYGLSAAGIRVDAFISALVALVFFATAYMVEIFRAGFVSIPFGQHDALRALGVGKLIAYRRILTPQAVLIAAPSYVNFTTAVIAETSLASAIGLVEVTGMAKRLVQPFPAAAIPLYGTAAAIYFVIISSIFLAQILLERRVRALSLTPTRKRGRAA